MEVNFNLVKPTKFHSLEDTMDPHYLSGLVTSLHSSLSSGRGTTSLELHGCVSLLTLIHPLTYTHYFKLARWLGFLATEKIKSVYEKYAASAVQLTAKVVDEMAVWIGRCRTFLSSLMAAFPGRRMRHLPWGEETRRWTVWEQMKNVVVAEEDWLPSTPTRTSPYEMPDFSRALIEGKDSKEEREEWEVV